VRALLGEDQWSRMVEARARGAHVTGSALASLLTAWREHIGDPSGESSASTAS
jgi:hypothetical protein